MLGISQRETQAPLSCYPVPSSRSGVIASGLCIKEIASQQEYKEQDYYNIKADYRLFFNLQSSTKKEETPAERVLAGYINDAMSRYKKVHHTEDGDFDSAEPFFSELGSLINLLAIAYITFYSDAVKAAILFKQREFIIDYDYEDPEYVFVSTFEGDKLIIKDGKVTELYLVLRSFDV